MSKFIMTSEEISVAMIAGLAGGLFLLEITQAIEYSFSLLHVSLRYQLKPAEIEDLNYLMMQALWDK